MKYVPSVIQCWNVGDLLDLTPSLMAAHSGSSPRLSDRLFPNVWFPSMSLEPSNSALGRQPLKGK